MKKIVSIVMVIAMLAAMCCTFTACGGSNDTYTVGICQLMVHESLDQATQGFIDALTSEMESAGKKVEFDTQVAGDSGLCTTVINTFTAKKVDLIMANATPALLAPPLPITPAPSTAPFLPTFPAPLMPFPLTSRPR